MLLILAGCVSIQPAGELKRPAKPPSAVRASAVVTAKRLIPISGRASVLAEAPDRFRVEVTGPMDQVVALLVSDGETFYVYSGAESKRHRWDDPALPYPFHASEITSLLLGSPRPPAKGAVDGYKVTADKDGRITGYVRTKGEKQVLKITTADYRDVGGVSVPFEIRIKNDKLDLQIRYTSVEADPEIDPGAFSMEGLP